VLAATPAARYLDSDNLVARLNLPNMQWTPEQKVEIYAKAIEGLLTLEPNIEKQIKYLDFVDIYTGLSDAERRQYEARYPQESTAMTGLAERLRTEGIQLGLQKGRQEGRQEGISLGEQKARRETAGNLIQTTELDDTTIAHATGLPQAEVEALRHDLEQ
jgi:predicted transposase/invertase (TIGR01784 family)